MDMNEHNMNPDGIDVNRSIAPNLENDGNLKNEIDPAVEDAANLSLFSEESAFVDAEEELRVATRGNKRHFSALGFALAVYTVVFLAASVLIMMVARGISSEFAESDFFNYLLPPVSLYVCALPFLLIFCAVIKGQPPEKKKISGGAWALYLMVCFGVMNAGSQISQILMSILTAIGLSELPAMSENMDGPAFWMYFVYCVIIAPVGEELVYRKILIDRTRKYGCFISALLSGLTFGFMHGNLYQLFFAFGVGFVMAHLYYRTGKLSLTIGIHAVINFLSVISYLCSTRITPLLENVMQIEDVFSMETSMGAEFIARYGFALLGLMLVSQIYAAGVACAIAIPIAFRKEIFFEKGEISVPREKRFSTLFLNVGAIVLFAIYFLEIVLSLWPK